MRYALVCMLVILVAATIGCQALNPTPPIETFANKFADQVIIPAVQQGLSQGVSQLALQAGSQTINPRYVVKFTGKWVTGIEGEASIGVDGLSGQLQVASTSDDATRTSPHASAQPAPAPTAEKQTPAAKPAAAPAPVTAPASAPAQTTPQTPTPSQPIASEASATATTVIIPDPNQ